MGYGAVLSGERIDWSGGAGVVMGRKENIFKYSLVKNK